MFNTVVRIQMDEFAMDVIQIEFEMDEFAMDLIQI